MTKTSVYMRSKQLVKTVNITSKSKPDVPANIKNKWQVLINLAAEVLNVPAGLIMKITSTDMEIFLKSQNNNNPYPAHGKDALGHGLYCETVVGTNQPLQVENALNDSMWNNNPDVKLNMIAYYGLPISWPDHEIFGTICLLDNKENRFGDRYTELMPMFKEIIETDLNLLYLNNQLIKLNNIDSLTGVASRKRVFEVIAESIHKFKKMKESFSLAMIDLNQFKLINDQYGHKIGDEVLIKFAKFVQRNIYDDDFFGRYGGDEFILLFPKRDLKDSEMILYNLKTKMMQDTYLSNFQISFTYGCVEVSHDTEEVVELLDKADQRMYDYKKR